MRKRIFASLTLLALCASGVFAQVVRQDGTGTPTSGNKQLGTLFVGGISRTDSVARMLTLDASNNLLVKEQSPVNSAGALRNFGISSTSINARGSQIGTPIQYNDASSGVLQFTLAAADSADTSCAFLVMLYGKQGSLAGDGLDFQIPVKWGPTFFNNFADSTLNGAMPSGYFIGMTNNTIDSPYWSGDIIRTCVRVPGVAKYQTHPQMSKILGLTSMIRTRQFEVPIPPWVRASYLNVVVINMGSAAHAITVDCYVHGN